MDAYNALVHSSIDSLPVDINRIISQHNIRLIDYSTFCMIYGKSKDDLYRSAKDGFSFYDKGEGLYVCVINENIPYEPRRRFTLAHELGHILLGHLDSSNIPDEAIEQEADDFASELIAPSTVLHFCGVSSPREIATLCGLSDTAAKIKFEQLSALRKKDERNYRSGQGCVFLSTDEKIKCFNKFTGFISSYITRRQYIS